MNEQTQTQTQTVEPGSGQEVLNQMYPQYDAGAEEAPKEEAPKEEAPKEEAPKEKAPKEEAPKEEDKQDEPFELTVNKEYQDFADKDLVEEYAQFAKEAGIDREKANTFLNTILARQREKLEAQISNWEKELKEDKEFGGDNFEKAVKLARDAVDKLGGEQLKDFFDNSGLGSHPELFRAFYRAGKSMSEAETVSGESTKEGGNKQQELLDRMFPHLASSKTGG